MTITSFAYLASYALSLLGNGIAAIALPLILLSTTGSVLGAGVVAAATAVPAVLAGLFAGVIIDRINRRTSSVVADVISALAIAALPIVDMVSGLTIGWFVLFGIIGSIGDVPGMTAREALLPAIVRHGGMPAERLMGIRESLGAVMMLLGPAAAGTLMVLFDGSTVLWITAATSLAAALISLLIPRSVGVIPVGPDVDSATGAWRQFVTGWRALIGSRFLVTITVVSLGSVVVLSGIQGLVLPVYFTLIEQPGLLGFVLTAMAAGALVGGGLYAAVGAKIRRRVWFVTGVVGTTIGFGVIAGLWSPGTVFIGAAIIGLASGLFGGVSGVLLIERIPEHLRGRIMSVQNALMMAAAPLGLMVAAVTTEFGSAVLAAVVVTGIWVAVAVVALLARSMRTLETPPPADGERMPA